MDLEAVRAFVAVAETTQFQSAARRLGISQQAVSKRIAVLERDLGLRLLARSPRGALLTLDGQALLPHARELLRAEARALAAIRPDARALRVDVINLRSGPAHLLREFHRAHSDVPLEVLTIFDAPTALEAVRSGSVDATFRAAPLPGMPLPRGLVGMRVMDEALMLVLGPRHPLASRESVRPAELADYPIWMPSLVAGTEWAVYYAELSRALGISIDTSGPNFGSEEMFTAIMRSSTLATFMGARTRPASLPSFDLRLVALHEPTPAYPHSLIWHRDNTYPAVALLRHTSTRTPAELATTRPGRRLSLRLPVSRTTGIPYPVGGQGRRDLRVIGHDSPRERRSRTIGYETADVGHREQHPNRGSDLKVRCVERVAPDHPSRDQAIHLVQHVGELIEVVPHLGSVRPGEPREDRNDRRHQHARDTGGRQRAGNVGKPLPLTQMLAQPPTD